MAITKKTAKTPNTAATQAPQYGFFENAAVWLLSRLPLTNHKYQNWSKTKRIVIGLLLYIICLPVIPVIVGIILYIRDPQGFKNGNAIKVLGVVITVWLGLFGLIGMQPSVPENPLNQQAKVDGFNKTQKATPEANQNDDSDNAPADQKSEERKKVQNKTTSAATKGRFFKNCDAAFAVDVFDIKKSDPAYQARLDRDSDGIACEK
jgi:Excalibur calcium-binding domain